MHHQIIFKDVSYFLKQNLFSIILVGLGAGMYLSFAYDLQRTDSVKLLSLYTALFFVFYKLLQTFKHNFRFLVVLAILFRILFLFAIPNLSQDFYRFIWDGRLLLAGFNPYLYTPDSFISASQFPIAQAQELYDGMGALSAGHYTNYPPIKQTIFAVAGWFSGNSILGAIFVFRLCIIIADIGTVYLGKKLLESFKLPTYYIFLYVLNPFVIIELTGNLHFEGIMIFFFVWSLYLLNQGKWKLAGAIFAISVSVKLIPLLFLPLFFKFFIPKFKKPSDYFGAEMLKLITFYGIILLCTLLLFAPFFSMELLTNYASTVGLWFNNFEFNASIYYLAREIGYQITGYNQIAVIGKLIPVISILALLLLIFFRPNQTIKQLIPSMLLALSFYFFMSTTVHPWYIATLLILSVFTHYRFPLVWSFMIILSYLAYNHAENQENFWILSLEYLIVYGVFVWEVFIKRSRLKTN